MKTSKAYFERFKTEFLRWRDRLGLTQYNLRHLPACEDEFPDMTELCVLCQAKAKQYMYCKDFGEIRSVSFRKAFRQFDAKKLRRY